MIVRPSLRERQQQLREEAIMEAAHELMASQGYATMTMDGVAARVGISKATLYRHFSSKEDLAISVIVRLMSRSEEYIDSLDPALPAIERIENGLRWALKHRFLENVPDLGAAGPALMPMINEHPKYRQSYCRLVDMVIALIREAQAAGNVDPDICPRIAVQISFSIMRDFEYEDLLASGECNFDQLNDTLLKIILDGMAPRPNG
ncbi:MAG: TetR/AcrR family transcriptional regulator [Armatimonadetes bacterium]|nr:TetR/AcrR family transcriptional regulator [Armatimonadota bacterium]